MVTPIDFRNEAAKALELQAMPPFVDRHASDPSFWMWLNSDTLDLRFFLAVGINVATGQLEKLLPSRRLILRHYAIALQGDVQERRSRVITILDRIRRPDATQAVENAELREAARYVLANADPPQLRVEAQRALVYFYVLVAGRYPELNDAVTTLIGHHPELFSDRAFICLAAATFGPRLLKLLARACIESRAKAEDVSRIIENVTRRPRGGRAARDYAIDILGWIDESGAALKVNRDAMYPAPPMLPLFEAE